MLSRRDEDRLVVNLWKAIDGDNRQLRRTWVGIAAIWTGLIVVLGGGFFLLSKRSQKVSTGAASELTAVSTGYQQVRKVLLPDSSVVWLNSATHLSWNPDFTENREVILSGEAFFQVAPDAKHPFVVWAGKTATRVFGTAFNVSAYPEAGQLRVSLQSGRVGVEYDGKEGKSDKILKPGQLLIYDKMQGSCLVMQQEAGEMDVWTVGHLVFYETPLKEALAQVEARYGVHIVYDQPLKDQTITARFENTALETVLEHLSFGWDLHFIRNKDTLHVRQGK